MSMTYFSVDVETTSTSVFSGELLTIGAVAIDAETLEILDDFYIPLRYDNKKVDEETLQWWKDVPSKEVFDAAWGEDFERHTHIDAASRLAAWVTSFSMEWKERVFAANPVSFDWPWIDKLFITADIKNPFHYRTLCMRSMYFGLEPNITWGESRVSTGEFHTAEMPHHALSDALAQAKDLVYMIGEKNRRDANLTAYKEFLFQAGIHEKLTGEDNKDLTFSVGVAGEDQ